MKTVEELVNLARTDAPDENLPVVKTPRFSKEVELFIHDLDIKHGQKKVHNLIVYDLYCSWSKENAVSLLDFLKAFSHYFPKKKTTSKNLAFALSKKYKGGKFDTSKINLDKCRELYGRKKSKTTSEEQKVVKDAAQTIETGTK